MITPTRSSDQHVILRGLLNQRLEYLLTHVGEALARHEDVRYQEIAGSVHDLEDDSVADLLIDLQLAEIGREVDEIQEILAARDRMADGSYDTCRDCGDVIDYERHLACPTAKRCHVCQSLYERTHAGGEHPSL